MVFNVVARNQHDHVKNIAFLMNPLGEWSLAPAFDVTYSFNPAGAWTGTHQMTLNGKRDGFTREDFVRPLGAHEARARCDDSGRSSDCGETLAGVRCCCGSPR
jgi:serine/threonine protein kinase HipA of HipAB toxin-antitoxin module